MIPHIDNPDGWSPVFSLVTVSPDGNASCGVNIITLIDGVSTEKFTTEQLKQLRSLDSYQAVREMTPLKSNNVDWRVCEYKWTEAGEEYHQLQCFMVAGPQGYVFFASAPESQWAQSKTAFITAFRSIDFDNPVLVPPDWLEVTAVE